MKGFDGFIVYVEKMFLLGNVIVMDCVNYIIFFFSDLIKRVIL